MKKLLIILLLTTLFASCNKDDTNNSTTVGDVVIKLNEIKEITATSAICDVIIIDNDNLGVIGRGVCWNKDTIPNILNNHTSDGEGDGEFESVLTNLTSNTRYFVRAYAMLENAIKYGDVHEFTTLEDNPNPNPGWWSPEPVDGHIPSSVLPDELFYGINQYINIYQGNYPPEFDGEFVSSPHILFYSTIGESIGTIYNDRYIAFFRHGDKVDFFGKQWYDEMNIYYEEVYQNLSIIGSSNSFTTYYVIEGYPDGLYAKQSTIFSGTLDSTNNAINDFKVVTILLETSGNPNLVPVNTYRILGDGDGVSESNPWLIKSSISSTKMLDEDLFSAFRVK